MNLMLAGDTHGQLQHWQYLIGQATQIPVKRIFVLGDFGYWEHQDDRYLHKLSRMLRHEGITCYFLDGNHENHPLLWEKYTETDDEGFVIVRDNILYSPRGHRWTWDGVSFLSLGGAHSVDKNDRIEGKSWWPTETITEDDVKLASVGGKVDVLLSHDAPAHVDIGTYMYSAGKSFSMKFDNDTKLNRERLHEVVVATSPKYIFHGHWHLRYMDDRFHLDGHRVRVEGLDCHNTFKDSWKLIHLREGDDRL